MEGIGLDVWMYGWMEGWMEGRGGMDENPEEEEEEEWHGGMLLRMFCCLEFGVWSLELVACCSLAGRYIPWVLGSLST